MLFSVYLYHFEILYCCFVVTASLPVVNLGAFAVVLLCLCGCFLLLFFFQFGFIWVSLLLFIVSMWFSAFLERFKAVFSSLCCFVSWLI